MYFLRLVLATVKIDLDSSRRDGKIRARTEVSREILAFCQTKKRRSTKQLFSKASEPLEKPFSFIKDPEFLQATRHKMRLSNH